MKMFIAEKDLKIGQFVMNESGDLLQFVDVHRIGITRKRRIRFRQIRGAYPPSQFINGFLEFNYQPRFRGWYQEFKFGK